MKDWIPYGSVGMYYIYKAGTCAEQNNPRNKAEKIHASVREGNDLSKYIPPIKGLSQWCWNLQQWLSWNSGVTGPVGWRTTCMHCVDSYVASVILILCMYDCIVSTTNTRQVYCVVSNGYLIGWMLAQRKVGFEIFTAEGVCACPKISPHPPGRPTPCSKSGSGHDITFLRWLWVDWIQETTRALYSAVRTYSTAFRYCRIS